MCILGITYMLKVWMDLALSLVTSRDSFVPQFEVRKR